MTARLYDPPGAHCHHTPSVAAEPRYAFLELPKLPVQKPEAGAGYWAWLFVHAPELTAVPADLPPGPYREALELANEATFSQEERDAYQKVIDEIQQVRELAEAKWAEGQTEGRTSAKAEAVLAVLAARGIPVSADVRSDIEACKEVVTLDRCIVRAATAVSAEEVVAVIEEHA